MARPNLSKSRVPSPSVVRATAGPPPTCHTRLRLNSTLLAVGLCTTLRRRKRRRNTGHQHPSSSQDTERLRSSNTVPRSTSRRRRVMLSRRVMRWCSNVGSTVVTIRQPSNLCSNIGRPARVRRLLNLQRTSRRRLGSTPTTAVGFYSMVRDVHVHSYR